MTTPSPVSALVNAEATLVQTIGKITDRVEQVGTVDLPQAMENLGSAVDRARSRLKASQVLVQGMLVGLANDFLSLADDINADLSLSLSDDIPTERLTVSPSEDNGQHPLTSPALPPVDEETPHTTPREETQEEADPFEEQERRFATSFPETMFKDVEVVGTATVTVDPSPEWKDLGKRFLEASVTEEEITTAANPPAEDAVPAPLVPVQGDGTDETTVEPSATGKRPRGKRGATKGKSATAQLKEKGAVVERREDRHGDTKSGWWLDGVWLAPANDPQSALRAIEGN